MTLSSRPRVPDRLRAAVLSTPGNVLRRNVTLAQAEMLKLGVAPTAEFFTFFSEFVVVCFSSTTSDESLCDVSEPTPEIALGTRFVQEVWELPAEFICITSCQGEGGYLYSTATESVYDFSLAQRVEFLRNPVPRWKTFFEFIDWYLAPAADA